MGNIAGYINSYITCRQKENVEYELYPGIPPWKTFQQELVDGKEYGHIGFLATKDMNIEKELLCSYTF